MSLLPHVFRFKLLGEKDAIYKNVETIYTTIIGFIYPSILQLIK